MKIEAIDLFCGIGGLSYGLKTADIDVLAGLDNDETCAEIYKKNNDAKFVEADVSTYDFSSMRSLYSPNSVRVLVGCAPCQPFSSHSFKDKEREKDERWNLIEHFIRAVDALEPHIVSVENVRGFMRSSVFKKFCKDLEARGYNIAYKVVYCPDYGIPQGRNRLVLLGSKLAQIGIPAPTHDAAHYETVGSTIKSLPKLKAGERSAHDLVHRSMGLTPTNLKRIRISKPNGTWEDWPAKLRPQCFKKKTGESYTPVYGRMSWKDVSPTITTQFFNYGSGRFGHPTQARAISLREGALLQSFPANYYFDVSRPTSQIGKHIGNAVPPRLGYVIGMTIRSHVAAYHEKHRKTAAL